MRTYKFRDFDLETNTVRYFDIDEYDRNKHDCYANMTQFTGLTDVSGKDIYEGDILQIDTVNGTVVWEEDGFVVKGNFVTIGLNTALRHNRCLIVDNIYNERTIQ